MSTAAEELTQKSAGLPRQHVQALLNVLGQAVLVTDREGHTLVAGAGVRKYVPANLNGDSSRWNVFREALALEPKELVTRTANAEDGLELEAKTELGIHRVRVKWVAEADWLTIDFAGDESAGKASAATQPTVQELLQEREITYRNLLAAYLRLQEVNR